MAEIINQLNACRDARFVRPLQQPCRHASNSICADARTVRPYISISRLFMCNMAEIINHSSACRDVRFVRPFQQPCIYAFNSICADARTVRPYTSITRLFMCKMAEIINYSGACRDARFVRPLRQWACFGSLSREFNVIYYSVSLLFRPKSLSLQHHIIILHLSL